jgi:RimJ/RimL family protein N-acetyltransferase
LLQSIVMSLVTTLAPIPLEGRFVRLEPYNIGVKAELQACLDCDQDAWALFSKAGFSVHFETWWSGALEAEAAGKAIDYAIRRLSDGRIVGTSSFLNLRPKDRGVEIGATFLHPDVRAGVVNPEAKRLMLAHAFEGGLFGAPAHRVELVTDARNRRSQAAIAKLGAVREGVLRKHKLTWTGHVRDTVVFSITAEDWPLVRDGLDARLSFHEDTQRRRD